MLAAILAGSGACTYRPAFSEVEPGPVDRVSSGEGRVLSADRCRFGLRYDQLTPLDRAEFSQSEYDEAKGALNDRCLSVRYSSEGLAISGFIITILVLFLFLRDLRAVGVVAIAVPVSLLVAAALLYLGGYTLNLITMLGLVVGIGMLVDNSVVVFEAVQRGLERGLKADVAAVAGIRRTPRAGGNAAAGARQGLASDPPARSGDVGHQQVQQGEQHRTPQGGQEAADPEAGDERGRELEHERVHHEQEEPEGEHRDRQREHDEHGAHEGVGEAEHERAEQRGERAVHLEAADRVGHHEQQGGRHDEVREELHGPRALVRPAPVAEAEDLRDRHRARDGAAGLVVTQAGVGVLLVAEDAHEGRLRGLGGLHLDLPVVAVAVEADHRLARHAVDGRLAPVLGLAALEVGHPAARVLLEGRPGVDPHAVAMPKGHDAGLAYLRQFMEEARASGFIKAAIDRAGLRGVLVAPSR